VVNQAQSVLFERKKDNLKPNESYGEQTLMSEVYALSSIPTSVLLPIDLSPSSESTLKMVSDFARHFQAELYFVNAIPFFPTTTMPDFIAKTSFLQEVRSTAKRNLAKRHKALAGRGVKIVMPTSWLKHESFHAADGLV
jgi:hypothetical protein